jgi:DNA polymerase-3 subunit epsilon
MTLPGINKQKVADIAKRMVAGNPVYLDTETTGLDKTAEIVEIGVVDSDGSILYQSYVRPAHPIPPAASAIHNISNEMVASAPSWPTIWAGLRPLLVSRNIGIYNAEFDLRLMRQSLEQYHLTWRENLTAFDIMTLYAEYRGVYDPARRAYKLFRLEEAGRQFGISLPNSHRAADDSLLARAVLHCLAGIPY